MALIRTGHFSVQRFAGFTYAPRVQAYVLAHGSLHDFTLNGIKYTSFYGHSISYGFPVSLRPVYTQSVHPFLSLIPRTLHATALGATESLKQLQYRQAKLDTFDFGAEKFVCNECGQRFKLEKKLTQHCKLHKLPADKVFECPECGDIFEEQRTLAEHRNVKHSAKMADTVSKIA